MALAALVPADKVGGLAARSDVQSISPNRLMTRSASTLETVTGTAAIRSTGSTNYNGLSGYTGRGIGMDRQELIDNLGTYPFMHDFVGNDDEKDALAALRISPGSDRRE